MKRIISLISAFVLLLSVAVSSAVFAKAEPTFEVTSTSGYSGDQIKVDVLLKNSPGFGGMAYDVKYDNTKLKLISYTTDLGKSICTDSGKDRYPDKVNFQYAGISNIEGDGVLASFMFEVLDGASGTTQVTVIPEEGTTFYYVGRVEHDFTLSNASGIVTIQTRPVPVTGFSLDKTTADVKTGDETLTLTPVFTPENATNKNVTWSSSDESVATVQNGVVSLLKKGVVTITAATEDGNYKASCVITIACSHKQTQNHPAQSSTCLVQGHGAYTVCKECGEVVSGSDAKLPLADHTYVENADAKYLKSSATCNSKAVYYKSCSVCGVKGTQTFEHGGYDSHNHIGETYIKDYKEATCLEEGYTGDTYCRGCDTKLIPGTAIQKNAHNPAVGWTTDNESHWKVCQTAGCGHIIDKAVHTGGTATCKKKAVCEVCGVEYGTVNAANHINTEKRNVVEATCTTDGYSGDTYCKDCGVKIADGTVVPAGHKFSDYKSDAKDHWKECDCGSTIEKAAHKFGEWKVTKEATADTKGNRERVCSVCGYKAVEEIAAIAGNGEKTSPTTGDAVNVSIWIVATVFATVSMIGVVLRKKRIR